jgi:homospermidine synthase
LPGGASVNLHGSAQTACLDGHGANFWLKSWVPSLGEQQGMLVTHHEVVSMADMLATDIYRPTVCYVYNPGPKARESLAKWRAGHAIDEFRVQMDVHGFDEIGVLLVHDTGALWHGSTLSADVARQLAPFNNATSMQVAAGIIGAMAWMLDHPCAGVVEAENMDSEQVLAVARPWLGKITTVETDWHPGRRLTFDEFLLTVEHEGSHKHIEAGNIRVGKLKEVRT